jgi:hypothetical protein
MNPFIGPVAGEDIPVGKPYLIEWSPNSAGPVYIQLSNYNDNLALLKVNITGISFALILSEQISLS